jgi:ribosome-binding protein aMBF1 (putative translation factor)
LLKIQPSPTGRSPSCRKLPANSDQERATFAELAMNVAERRKQKGISQVRLAEALDVSQQSIQD